MIIKHGAFGDFILATGPFKAIRDFHANAHLTLLTTAPFVTIAHDMNLFDTVLTDQRARGLAGWVQRVPMALSLRRRQFDRVYDLQHSRRTALYHIVMGRAKRQPIEWSGIATGCSHPHTTPERETMHTIERTRDQLRIAGLTGHIPEFYLEFLKSDPVPLVDFPSGPYAILAPATSERRPEKAWPIQFFSTVAHTIAGQGLTPVVIGTKADTHLAHIIQKNCPATVDLTGQTDIHQLAWVGRHADIAIGNDTGPMHLLAPLGCPCLVLFSGASDPSRTAPRGPHVRVMQQAHLKDLRVKDVLSTINRMIHK